MGIHIQDLKSATGDYARAYLFNIYFNTAPVDVTGGESMTSYLVRSSSLPEDTIEALEVPYQGQVQKLGSTRTFAEWEVTFNLDRAAWLRKQFVEWMNRVHDPATNAHGRPADYYGIAKAELISGTTYGASGGLGSPVMTYTLNDVWPSSVGALDLAQDSKEVAQFSVTFTYNWHETE